MTTSPPADALPELPAAVAHVHSNADFCMDRAIAPNGWPAYLYTADQMRAYALSHAESLRAEVARLEAMLASHEESVEQFKRAWMKVPPFADKVNKATRYAITEATSIVVNATAVARAALKEQA